MISFVRKKLNQTRQLSIYPIEISCYSFWIFFLFLLFVTMIEFIDLIAFLLNMPQSTLVSRLFVGCIWICVAFLLSVNAKISFEKQTATEHFFFYLILILGIIKSCFPDTAYDTLHYHIISHDSGFKNWFSDPYVALGNFQIWGFRLGDRALGIFHKYMGYRMGTILNTFVLLIIYLQIISIIKKVLLPSINNTQCTDWMKKLVNPALLSFCIVTGHDCLMMLGSYYVDILGIPFALECIRILLKGMDKETTPATTLIFALFNGLWFALKMTNIVFIFPLVICYIWIHRKEMSWKIFMLSSVLAAFPMSIYMVFNTVCTKNPVFPYYNSFFESPYFWITNWNDGQFGGINSFERFFWIFNAIFNTGYRLSEIPDKYTYIYIIGLIGILFFAINCLKNKFEAFNKKRIILLLLIIFSSSLLWSFTTGIARYYIPGMIYISFMSVFLIYWLIQKKSLIYNAISVILIGIFLLTSFLQIKDVMGGREWSWRSVTPQLLADNLTKIFKDYSLEDTSVIDVNTFCLTDSQYGGYAYLYPGNSKIINARYIGYISDPTIQQMFSDELQMSFNGNVYDIRKRNFDDVESYIYRLNEMGLTAYSFSTCTGNISPYLLINIGFTGQPQNTVTCLYDKKTIDSLENQSGSKMRFIIGKYYLQSCNEYILKIYEKRNNQDFLLYQNIFNGNNLENVEVSFNHKVTGNNLYFEVLNTNKTVISESDNNRIIIINPYLFD